MITETEYKLIRAKIDTYEASKARLYPCKNCFTPEMIENIVREANCGSSPTNEERSAVEVYEFVHDAPDRYFVYVNKDTKEATTWTGDKLGAVVFGREYRDNFGGKRIPITVFAINGTKYHGTYYASSGDYARIKRSK